MAILAKTQLPIIISGTGPAALLLAHMLLRTAPSLPIHLYERDLSMTHRAQGYRFRITSRGVSSCREALSPKHFALLRATCGDNENTGGRKINTTTGESQAGFPKPPLSQGEPEPLAVDRTVMRQTLFKGLENYTTFGKEIIGYETAAVDGQAANGLDDNHGVSVRFADGSSVRGALLVGADGAYSPIRAQLTPQVQLLDSEMRMILGKTPLTPAFHAAIGASGTDDPLLRGIARLVDPSPRDTPMFFMFDPMRFGGRAAVAAADPSLAAAIPDDYIYWALAQRSDQPEVQGYDWRAMDSSTAADLAEDLTKSWLPSLRAVVTHQDRAQTVSLLSAVVPVPLVDWRAPMAADKVGGASGPRTSSDHRAQPAAAGRGPMVTLIGDAAHAMPPTGGRGATTALTDAVVLGAALATHGVSHRALEVYETEMREYAGQAIEASVQGGKMFVNMRTLAEMKPMGQC